MMYVIFGAAIVIAALFYFYKEKGLSLSADEQSLVNGVVSQKQKALSDFTSGKEGILSEYESLKADVEKALGLQAKLPVSPIIASSPVVAPIPPAAVVPVPVIVPAVPPIPAVVPVPEIIAGV